jgi:uncharacterized protein YdcH (DUF465 family)
MNTNTHTHRARTNAVRLGVVSHKGEYLMENHTQDDMKAHLLATDEGFRNLNEQHAHYSKLIDEIEAKGLLSDAEELEEHRLKKLKLHVKDQMNEIAARYRTAAVS